MLLASVLECLSPCLAETQPGWRLLFGSSSPAVWLEGAQFKGGAGNRAPGVACPRERQEMKLFDLRVPKPFHCECGKELVINPVPGPAKTEYELNRCPCGRDAWHLPGGALFGIQGGPLYYYPRKE